MGEPLKVEWTARAEVDLDRIHTFILEHWSSREADRFLNLFQEFELLIAQWPNGFKRSANNTDLRLGLVHRNTSTVYRVFRDRVVIITLFDNRSNVPR